MRRVELPGRHEQRLAGAGLQHAGTEERAAGHLVERTVVGERAVGQRGHLAGIEARELAGAVQDLLDVPAGVVVGEDGAAEVVGGAPAACR